MFVSSVVLTSSWSGSEWVDNTFRYSESITALLGFDVLSRSSKLSIISVVNSFRFFVHLICAFLYLMARCLRLDVAAGGVGWQLFALCYFVYCHIVASDGLSSCPGSFELLHLQSTPQPQAVYLHPRSWGDKCNIACLIALSTTGRKLSDISGGGSSSSTISGPASAFS